MSGRGFVAWANAHAQEAEALKAKKARHARAYGAGEIQVGRSIGAYPPDDAETEETKR